MKFDIVPRMSLLFCFRFQRMRFHKYEKLINVRCMALEQQIAVWFLNWFSWVEGRKYLDTMTPLPVWSLVKADVVWRLLVVFSWQKYLSAACFHCRTISIQIFVNERKWGRDILPMWTSALLRTPPIKSVGWLLVVPPSKQGSNCSVLGGMVCRQHLQAFSDNCPEGEALAIGFPCDLYSKSHLCQWEFLQNRR